MRAIGVTEYGGPEALHEVEVEREPLGPGEVRVQVLAAAVNPTDTYVRNGGRDDAPRAKTVAVPGMDVCGSVLELGDGVDDRLAVGQLVMAVVVPSGEHGAYREEIVLPSGSVVSAPSGFTDAEIASVPMNTLTACLAFQLLDLPTGATIAVTGAAGAFGGAAVQLAKEAGLTVIADASDADRDLVAGFGADTVLPRGAGFADAVRELHPDGVDALLDGSVQGPEVTGAVRDGGGFATVRGWDGDGDTRLSYHPTWVRNVAERHDLLDRITALVERGVITPRVADVLPAADAAEAHRRLEAGGVRGRLVLDFT
ncbi:MAG: NADP-dependent oxidoreductase [Aeromicrobium sp.]